MRSVLLALAVALGSGWLATPAPAGAQSVLERSPNIHGVWTIASGTAAFVFAHRFEFFEGGDELFNVPTLTAAVGLPLGVTLGLDYSSYSEVVPARYTGNETQYWLKRRVPAGGVADVAALVAYNTAARSWDGAVNVGRRLGPIDLYGEARGFSDRFGLGEPGVAGAIGAGIRLTPYLGLTADIGRVLDEDSIPSTWSAAVAVVIPGSPHTFSIQATNGGAITLQGASREKVAGRDGRTRYGFVFTVPLGTASRWARIFRPDPPAARPTDPAAAASDTAAATVEMRLVAFTPGEVRIRAGQSVEWVNRDPIEHTATANDGSWGSEPLKEGERYVRRFDTPGRYPYHCTPHPQMQGVVIVEGDG